MLLHRGRASILSLCTEVARAASASPQGTTSGGTKQLHVSATETSVSVNSCSDCYWCEQNYMGLISENCILGNMRLMVFQCLWKCLLHTAATEVPLPFSSPHLGLSKGSQRCPATPLQLRYHLSAAPMAKSDCSWALARPCANFTPGHIK